MASTADLVTKSATDLNRDQSAEEKKTFKTMTFKERALYIKEIVTIEPLLCCYLMASIVCGPALANLEFEKCCKANERFNDTICDAILTGTYKELNFTEENDAVQQRIIKMHSWQNPLQSIMPIVLVLFLGSYSDRHKVRKPFLLIPIVGEFFAVAGCILCVFYMRELPLEFQGFVQTIVPSFLGGPTMIIMASFAYIGDVSTIEMRTLRVGVVQIVLNIWTPIVQSFSGVLFSQIGYYGLFMIAGGLYALGLLYGIFWIKEPKKSVDVAVNKSLVKDLFDPLHAVETFKLLGKKGEGNQRLGLLIVMLILFVYTCVVTGEGTVFFLFAQTFYQWTVVEFSYLLTFNTIIHLVGNIVALPLFTKVWNLNDLVIAVISFTDKIVTNLIITVFTSITGLYVGITASILVGIASISIRSQATKVVSEDDLGKAQSLFAIIEAIAPMISIPVYNQGIYSYTLESFPQAFFLLGIGLYILGIIFLMWLYVKEKNKPVATKETTNNQTETTKNDTQKDIDETSAL